MSQRPRRALKAALLAAMKQCPEGQPSGGYADAMGYCYKEVSKAAGMLRDEGLVVWFQFGTSRVWTAIEHRLVMKRRCEAELAARRAEAKARKRVTNRKHDEKRRGRVGRPRGEWRYRWPATNAYEPPGRLIASVWDLAA